MTDPAVPEDFPASFGQTRLWILDQITPGLDYYHISLLWSVQGPLDPLALQQALDQLLIRHESLRTSFYFLDGQVMQRIHPPCSCPLRFVPLSVADEPGVCIVEESLAPFDLSQAPLLRAMLIERSADQHLLLLTTHHIVSDAWSLSLLQKELSIFYQASRLDSTPDLPPLPIQYADFSVWQRQQLSGMRREQLLGYWRGQLADLQPLELPSDHPRPALPSHRGASLVFDLDGARAVGLESLCQRQGATLQMGLLALVAVLLQRYSRSDDIPIGVPHWGRNHPDLEGLVGFFVNILVLRCDLAEGPSFLELLAKVRSTSLEAYEHQDLPFEELVEALQPERDRSRHPLVQVMVQLLDLPSANLSLSGLTVQPLRQRTERVRFDLEFAFRRVEQGLRVSIGYSTDLFDAGRIERLQGHLTTLLDGVLAAPERAIAKLPLLSAAEAEQLDRWSQGPHIDPPDLCIHQLFEQQVERSPEAIALVFEDQQLTYRELNARTNQLAHHLIDQGVGPEVIVAVCLERSIDLIVALLAILKAGGAYLPLDPAWPQERIELLIRESGCCMLIKDEQPVLNNSSPAPIPPAEASAASLAYVSYTSGSTGLPKAVAITHASILRVVDPRNGFRTCRGDRVLHLAPVAFDAATFEIWGPLLNGGTLVIAPSGQLSLPELAELLLRSRISTLWLTAGLFEALVDSQLPALASVRQVLAGGDVLSPEHVTHLLNAFPPSHELINGYGPTENTTFTCCHRLTAGEYLASSSVPIGRPIAATRVRVLDNTGQPCPIGIPGELHIGGSGLARGYLNNPELTAEKFIPDPFSDDPSARLYKSGDLVSWNPDGTLAFHGRLDQQIKLRGYRIEPGEIEANLLAHPAVNQAVVVLRNDDATNPRLIAYWVPQEATRATSGADQLRAHLAEHLPDYMVPAAFVALEALPLTPNGKLDRNALPAPDFSADPSQRDEPSTQLEHQLHAIWAEVLGHREFGVSDNFFYIGGHSLAAARLMSRIEQVLGSALPLAALFQAPTVQQLANLLCRQDTGSDWYSLIPIQPRGPRPPLFGIHLLDFRDLSDRLGPEQPIYGLRYGMGDAVAGRELCLPAIEELASHYIDEMRRFQPEGPYFLIGHSFGGIVAYEMAQQLTAKGESLGLLALCDSHITKVERRRATPREALSNIRRMGAVEFLRRAQRKLGNIGAHSKERRVEIPKNGAINYVPHVHLVEPIHDLMRGYQPKPCKYHMVLFRSVSPSILFNVVPPDVGWRKYALGGLDVEDVPGGDHRTILLEPHVKVLAEKLRRAMDGALDRLDQAE